MQNCVHIVIECPLTNKQTNNLVFSYSVPKGSISRVSPDELDTIENSLFTCYAESNEMPLPSELTLKLTSHENDYLPELLGSGAVELEPETTATENRTARWLIIKPSVSHYTSFVGLQLTYECHAKEYSCHEQIMFEPIAQNVSLYLNSMYNGLNFCLPDGYFGNLICCIL